MDSCFCHNWKEKKKYYDSLGYKYYIIRLICDDEVVKKRLENRNDRYAIANYNDYLWMKKNVHQVDDELIDYVIDTEKDVEIQVKDFLSRFNLIKRHNTHK